MPEVRHEITNKSVRELPPGAVVITTADMYQELRNLATTVDRLANAVDPALDQIRANHSALAASHEALLSRVHGIERKLWVASGVAAGLGGGAGWLASLLGG